MTDDVEARLRAALHAHAALVEELADDAGPPAAARAGRRRRPGAAVTAAVMAAAAAAVVGSVVWLGGPGTDQRDGADRPVTAEVPAAGSAGSTPAGPEVAAAPVVGEPFELYTHCGVLGADLDGVWFAADPPLVDEYGPPPGWQDPYQPGTLTRLSPAEAVFTDDAGHEVWLRADESARPPACA